MEKTTIKSRVKAGADWLDSKVPGWFRKIDLIRLDMRSLSLCVLAQACGDNHAHRYDSTLGFDATIVGGVVVREEYEQLADAWDELITARLVA